MEIWKTISEYPNYEVSSKGRIRNTKTGRIKKQSSCTWGYSVVGLCCSGNKIDCVKVHRLVANAFLPNPENKRTINHINGDKKDNRVENLEWATDSENIKHAFDYGLNKVTTKKRCRCIETGNEFDSILDASRHFGVNSGTIYSAVLKHHKVKGYHFELI